MKSLAPNLGKFDITLLADYVVKEADILYYQRAFNNMMDEIGDSIIDGFP